MKQLNPVCNNILDSLCGSFCFVDVETTAIKPEKGCLISAGFTPVNINRCMETGRAIISFSCLHNAKELWFRNVNQVGHLDYHKYDSSTMEWHRTKNKKAYDFYIKAFLSTEEIEYSNDLETLEEMFKLYEYNFISRHSFDSKWLEFHMSDIFNAIHYRRFWDIASMIRGMGFQDEVLYKSLQKDAKHSVEMTQTNKSNLGFFKDIPFANEYIEHRPFTDTLIDIALLQQMLDYVWAGGQA